MIRSVEELRAVVAGTMLDGRETAELTVPAPRGSVAPDPDESPSVLAVRIGSDEVLPAWRAARDLIERTGRWPIAVCSFDFELGPTSELGSVVAELDRVEFEWEDAGDTAPASIVERSRAVDVDAVLARLAAAADWLEEPDAGKVPDAVSGDDEWFEPSDQLVALLLLPDVVPEHALAYVHWYAGTSELPSHVLIAVLRRWREAFGAELVAHWRTMLQLVVDRRPDSVGEALALAREQELIAPCTTMLPGTSTEEHARTLLSSDRWFLHERP